MPGNAMVSEGMTDSEQKSSTSRKPLKNKGSEAHRGDVMASDGSAPRRTRTYNPLIKSQLLCQLS
jgi:hypothetical protein